MYVISLRHSIQYEQRIFLNSYLDTALKLYVVCTTWLRSTNLALFSDSARMRRSRGSRGSRGLFRLASSHSQWQPPQFDIHMRAGKGCARCRNRHIRCVIPSGASSCTPCSRLGRNCQFNPRFQFKSVNHIYQKGNGTSARYDLVWDEDQVWVDLSQPGKSTIYWIRRFMLTNFSEVYAWSDRRVSWRWHNNKAQRSNLLSNTSAKLLCWGKRWNPTAPSGKTSNWIP